MDCAFLSVGTELLFGQIINMNTVYLSQKLNMLGLNVMYHYTVGDNSKRLKDILEFALKKTDIVITTGGLGPTQDDLTKEIVAEVFDRNLILHEPSFERLENYFEKINREMTENNIKQVYMPEGAVIFNNDIGTAPGFGLEKNDKIIICLPGPPKEMKTMFENYVQPYLQKKSEYTIYSKVLHFFGIGESLLETKLFDLISGQTDPTLATYAKEGEVSLRITSKRRTLIEAEKSVLQMIKEVSQRVGEYVYSYDDEDFIEAVAKKLIKHNLSISLAESCTGGLFTSKLTDIPGISSVFDRSFITYSNESKIKELNVKKSTIETYGAVSRETALEMVQGVKEKTGSRICLAVTGIAGPGGGTEEKPVGLVYIAMMFDSEINCYEYRLKRPDRESIRNYSVLLMLNHINQALNEKGFGSQVSGVGNR
ncbi:MAG: competence/damage-inducible protein A [Clostridiales bacterium]|nr:competence/damage-inducible protein A [Clostridiales bacterium]